MAKIRIILHLHHFFYDHRSVCRILINKNMHTISDLQSHISNIFNINNFYLIAQNQYLPSIESVLILNQDEVVIAMPSKKSLQYSYISLIDETQKVSEIEEHAEEDTCLQKKIKRSKKEEENEIPPKPKKKKKEKEFLPSVDDCEINVNAKTSTPYADEFQSYVRIHKKRKKHDTIDKRLEEITETETNKDVETSAPCNNESKEKKLRKRKVLQNSFIGGKKIIELESSSQYDDQRREKKLKKEKLSDKYFNKPEANIDIQGSETAPPMDSLIPERKLKNLSPESVKDKVSYFEKQINCDNDAIKSTPVSKQNKVTNLNEKENRSQLYEDENSQKKVNVSELMRKHKLFVVPNNTTKKISTDLPKKHNIVKSIIVSSSTPREIHEPEIHSSGFNSLNTSHDSKSDSMNLNVLCKSNTAVEEPKIHEEKVKILQDIVLQPGSGSRGISSESEPSLVNGDDSNPQVEFAQFVTKRNRNRIRKRKTKTETKAAPVIPVKVNYDFTRGFLKPAPKIHIRFDDDDATSIVKNAMFENNYVDKSSSPLCTPTQSNKKNMEGIVDLTGRDEIIDSLEIGDKVKDIKISENKFFSVETKNLSTTAEKPIQKAIHKQDGFTLGTVEGMKSEETISEVKNNLKYIEETDIHRTSSEQEVTNLVPLQEETFQEIINKSVASSITTNEKVNDETLDMDVLGNLTSEEIKNMESIDEETRDLEQNEILKIGNTQNEKGVEENNCMEVTSTFNGNQATEEDYQKYMTQNISKCPLMTSNMSPQVGNVIAFKILRISENYTPEVSNYIVAKVLEIYEDGTIIRVHILDGLDETFDPVGKFCLDPKFANTVNLVQEYPLNTLLEKRLVSMEQHPF